jgi:threonylcarbamoyladenosine tRNA methylthiotransferase MtaB
MGTIVRVALDTLGCKLNQSETETLARQLAGAGYCLVTPDDEFDVYVLNTCTVTGAADAKARHLLRLARRRRPQANLVLTGCVTDASRKNLGKLPGLSLIVPNADKPLIAVKLAGLGYTPGMADPGAQTMRNRAFIKVQEGCNNFCAYCIVPYVRDKERSRPPEEVLAEIQQRVVEGYREVVLTGTEIGSYRYLSSGLAGLIEKILAETEIDRLRLSSLQPHEISVRLLDNWQNPRICPHFHLSLQSGSDAVLARMRRRYTSRVFENAVAQIRGVVKDAAITTDIIAGFPGETDHEFEETAGFCEQTGFARIHVFNYSPRRGTAAAEMPGQVPEKTKKERTRWLLEIARLSAKKYMEIFIGRKLDVLWEQQRGDAWSGYTGNYLRVYSKSAGARGNEITPATLRRLYKDGLWAEIPSASN